MIFEVGDSGQVQFMTANGEQMQLGEKVSLTSVTQALIAQCCAGNMHAQLSHLLLFAG